MEVINGLANLATLEVKGTNLAIRKVKASNPSID